MSKRNLLNGKNIHIGQKVWIIGGYSTPSVYSAVIDSKVQSVDGDITMSYVVIKPSHNTKRLGVFSTKFFVDTNSRSHVIFLGDKGVRPYNYDERPTQVFLTKRAAKKAMYKWKGINPNFIKGK